MASESWLREVRNRAKAALSKPSPYGRDVDVTRYVEYVAGKEPKLIEERAREVGVDFSAKAIYTQVDQAYFRYLSRIPGIEVKSIEDFIEENPDIARDYVWKLLDPALDKYTAVAALKGRGGFFIRVKENTRVDDPVMTCMFMSVGGLQAPHNVIVLEKGSQVTVYTGCTIAPESFGLHVGLSEFYVGEKAELRYVMVHAWNNVTHVRPRTVVHVAEEGKYISYYVNMSRVRTLQTYPRVIQESNTYALQASVLLGLGDSEQDVGGMSVLRGHESRSEIVSRIVARDESRVVSRARITTGVNVAARGHIECRGMLLSDRAVVETIPELEALSPNAVLTHEASIGKLAEDEINYLVTRGFKRDEAVGILIRGFVSIDVKNIPGRVKKHIETLEKIVAEKAL
ncbi:MAG: SufD family Fe-S cluster assembly protein [Desulfurococcaceae archaeon]